MRALPNLAERHLAEAIRRAGHPGGDLALWEFLRRSVSPDDLLVLALRGTARPEVLFTAAADPAPFARLESVYLAGAYLLDPFHDLHLSRAPAGAYRLADIAPDAFQRSRYYLDYYRQTTILDEISFVAHPNPQVSLVLSLGRDAASGRPFAPREVEACHRLAPVVAALAEAQWSAPAQAPEPEPDVAAGLARALRAAHGIALSPRQAEVALLILQGHSTASIALRLDVSPQTVKVFRKQLHARCRVSSQAELFALLVPLLARRG